MSVSTTDRLFHIIQETRYLAERSRGLAEDEFLEDEDLRDIFARRLEIIGEAASKLPGELRLRYAYVDWLNIIALRNVPIHEYFRVDHTEVWDIVVNYLPELRRNVEQIIEDERLG